MQTVSPHPRARSERALIARNRYVEALRDGRRERAATFVDRRKESSRRACRDWRRR